MGKIIKAISDVASVVIIYVVVISCFVFFGIVILNQMDQRAEVVRVEFYEVGR